MFSSRRAEMRHTGAAVVNQPLRLEPGVRQICSLGSCDLTAGRRETPAWCSTKGQSPNRLRFLRGFFPGPRYRLTR